jgi:hypothetical protein
MEDMAFEKFVAFCMMRVISFRFMPVVIRSAIGAGYGAVGYMGGYILEAPKGRRNRQTMRRRSSCASAHLAFCGCWLTS